MKLKTRNFFVNHVDEAIKKILVGNMYPTGILVNRDLIKILKMDKDFIDWWKVDEKWVPKNERTHHFQGMLKGLAVYNNPFFTNTMLVFDKYQINIVFTPIGVRFSGSPKPDTLVEERYVSSAPIIDNAVVDIKILD